MIDDNPNEAFDVVRSEPGPLLRQAEDLPFLITASELRDEKLNGDGSNTIYPAAPASSAGWSSSG